MSLEPASLNRYPYVVNNPINLTDLSGLHSENWPETYPLRVPRTIFVEARLFKRHCDNYSNKEGGKRICLAAVVAGSLGAIELIPQEVALIVAHIYLFPSLIGEILLLPADAATLWTQGQFVSIAYQGSRLPCDEIRLYLNPWEVFTKP